MQLNFTGTNFVNPENVVVPDIYYKRLKTGIDRIDNMLGGGFLPGSTFTLCGNPGLGKTQLMLQILDRLAQRGYNVGYISGEESVVQMSFTCKRISVKCVPICNETDVDTICGYIKDNDFDIVVVDSLQALTTKCKMNVRALERYVVSNVIKVAKDTECVVGFNVHVTKAGGMKGSTLVPHAVDVNLKLSTFQDAEPDSQTRVFFVDGKNRFGPLGDSILTLTSVGYDFDTEIVQPETSDVLPRKERKKEDYEKMIKQSVLDLQKAAELMGGNVTRARWMLKDLVDTGVMVKTGRGTNSIWKVVAKNN